MPKCQARTEVYSRIVGYFRPVQTWNKGKKEEFSQRKVFDLGVVKTLEQMESGDGNSLGDDPKDEETR